MVGQASIPPIPAGTSLAGQTILITGGNTGLGFETARQYLKLQASRVIITVRSESKGHEAISLLRADPAIQAANPSAKIDFYILDLDDYQSGLNFCQKVKLEVPELDILLCNAGMNIMKYEAAESGHEKVMQANCYTHLVIAFELLPLLRSTAIKRGTPSRLTFVGSSTQSMHTFAKRPIAPTESILAHFDNRETYDGMRRYSDSKLVINAFTRRLATVVSADKIIVNNVCPGMVATGFDKGLPGWIKIPFIFIRKVMARTVEEGGWTLVHASVVAGKESHGKFIQNNKVDPGARFLDESKGKEFIEKLWTEIAAEAKAVDPELEIVV